MKRAVKKQAKLINIKKATKSKEAVAETKRVIEVLIDYRIKNGVKDEKGVKGFPNADVDKKKEDRLVWLENQRLANLTTPKELPIIPTVEERMEKLDTTNLSVEDLMLAKEKMRSERIKELNKQLY